MAEDTRHDNPPKPARSAPEAEENGLIRTPLRWLVGFVAFLCSSLLLALVVEWVGMFFFWPDLGVEHSRLMMEKEVSFLAEDFRSSLFAASPAAFAAEFSRWLYYWLVQWTGLEGLVHWLEATPAADATVNQWLHAGYRYAQPFVISGLLTLQTFSLRLAVLLLSLPGFALFGVGGVLDGLMRRDLRRWGGGRESSFQHHFYRRAVIPSVVAPWFLYLGFPVTVHPNLIILPCAVLFGVALCVSAATFKKYL